MFESPIRLIGLTQGKVSDPLASSGLNNNVFAALARRTELVDVLDISLKSQRRWWNLALSFRLNRDAWRVRADLNTRSFTQLSQLAGGSLEQRSGSFDIVFQLKALYSPGLPPMSSHPYFVQVDNTYCLCERFYPPWAPLRGAEKQRWLELERQTYHTASAVFCRTQWVRNSLINDYGLPPEKAIYTGTGVNFNLETLPKSKEQDDGRTLLFVGKEFKRKGLPTLIEAFDIVHQQYPDARLVVVGRDTDESHPGVEFLGKIRDRARIQELYAHASVFVLPSEFEPCGLVIPEAMAHFLPVIVSTGGGLAEFAGDGKYGTVVPPHNPVALAEAIIDLLRDPQKRARMGAAGRRSVETDYNWDRVVERMLPHFQSAVSAA